MYTHPESTIVCLTKTKQHYTGSDAEVIQGWTKKVKIKKQNTSHEI